MMMCSFGSTGQNIRSTFKLLPTKKTEDSIILKMGRTGRIRGRRRNVFNPNISNDSIFINLVKWLRSNEWTPSFRLQPVLYQDFGRGLMSKDSINKGDILFSLPYSVLITRDVVEKSPVACVFHCMNGLKAHDVLSLFLVWEKQCGSQSMWHNYIMSLPSDFTLPLFCGVDELAFMPPFISKAVEKQKKKIISSWKCISSILKTLQYCESCRKKLPNDFVSMKLNYDDFVWAWSVVNTRSVYCENKSTNICSINVVDGFSLALAPLLDMFNHSNESDLKAELCDGHYKIVATGSIQKYSQVFIHYGHHSNLHLYLEYGFIMSNNMYDVLFISIEEILKTTKELFPNLYSFSNVKKSFISFHNMYKDLICSSEGISFNVKGLIFLLTSPEIEKPNFQRKIYSSSYNKHENNIIDVVGQKLIELKIIEFTDILNAMNNKSEETSKSFNIAKCLIKEFLNMLTKAHSSFENK